MAAQPVARWSGCIMYRRHGSCDNTTVGRVWRMWKHTSSRSAIEYSSSPSRCPSVMMSVAPIESAAFRCSSILWTISTSGETSGSQVPLDPSVRSIIVMWAPPSAHFRQRSTCSELGIVWMGSDGQHPRRRRRDWYLVPPGWCATWLLVCSTIPFTLRAGSSRTENVFEPYSPRMVAGGHEITRVIDVQLESKRRDDNGAASPDVGGRWQGHTKNRRIRTLQWPSCPRRTMEQSRTRPD